MESTKFKTKLKLMNEFNDWLENLNDNNPELQDSVEKLRKYFTSDGFNTQEFESILLKGLKSIEQTVPNKLNKPTNAND
jgi:hypothetical protein